MKNVCRVWFRAEARTMSSEETRNRILESALRLFNERGAGEATTNHIAAEAGISPGNLYYHFKNREEIIRALFQQMVNISDSVWSSIENPKGSAFQSIADIIELVISFFRDYTFFMRDFHVIMQKDPGLAGSFREMVERRTEVARRFFDQMIASGDMEPTDESHMDIHFHNLWIVASYWYPYASLMGRADGEKVVSTGIVQTMYCLRPLLTRKGRKRLDEVLRKYTPLNEITEG